MQNETTKGLAQRFLQFLSARDLNNIVSLFEESVDWFIPGNKKKAIWLGKRNNRYEVRDFFKLLWENTEPVSASMDKLVIDNTDAVIIGEFSTRMLQTNKIVDSFFCIQMTFENNKIVKYRLFEDSYAVSEALTD
jgi:uncharacterized protein